MSKLLETLNHWLVLLERGGTIGGGNTGTAMGWGQRVAPEVINMQILNRQYARDVAAVKAKNKAEAPKAFKTPMIRVDMLSYPEHEVEEWVQTSNVDMAVKAVGRHRGFNLKKMPEGFVEELEALPSWREGCVAVFRFAAGDREISGHKLYRNLVAILAEQLKKWSIDKDGDRAHYFN